MSRKKETLIGESAREVKACKGLKEELKFLCNYCSTYQELIDGIARLEVATSYTSDEEYWASVDYYAGH